MEPVLTTAPEHLGILKEISRLEIILHKPEPGMTIEEIENMMAHEFWEVGASGRSYSREFVLNVLKQRLEKPMFGVWKNFDFNCSLIAPDNFLLSYTIQQGERISRRASIWRNTASGWRIVYHQGTIILDY